jgi:catechol 2,3-dioxygenase-like lactoylglutathione lyase family enzyme
MKKSALRIHTVEIPVANLKRAIDWYQTALGLICAWSDERHALLSGAQATGNEPRILLVETDDMTRLGFSNSSNGLHHSVIDFQTLELEDLHAFLHTQGTPVDDLKPPVNTWAPRGFGFSDSEGNRLAAFTNANESQTK